MPKPTVRIALALLTLAGGLGVAGEARAMKFVAELTACQVVPKSGGADPCGVSTAFGTAVFLLDDGEPRLDYDIDLTGFAPVGDVTGIHLHSGAPGANGPHVLNVQGLPAQDDAQYDPLEMTGSWGDEDENFAAVGDPGVRDPGDSIAFSDALADLLAGNLYIAVHSNAFNFPNTAELRGQILLPEPGLSALLVPLGLAAWLVRRRAR